MRGHWISAALRGRLGGLVNAARHTPRDMTAAPRAAFIQRFYDATDPALPEEERRRLSDIGLRLHMAKLALKRKARRG